MSKVETSSFAPSQINPAFTKRTTPKSGKPVSATDQTNKPYSWLERNNLRHSTGEPDVLGLIEGGCTSEIEILRTLAKVSPVFSTAVFNLVEIAFEQFRIKATNEDGSFDPVGTSMGKQLVATLASPAEGNKGYNPRRGVDALTATALQEAVLTGAVNVEALVKDGKVNHLLFIPEETVDLAQKDGYEVMSQNNKPLNYPNIFRATMHLHGNSLKPTSMLLPAVGMTSSFTHFIQSMGKSLDKSGHSRLVVTLNKEMYMNLAPKGCKSDANKMSTWLNLQRTQIATVLTELEPDQALVVWDDQEAKVLEGNMTKSDYSTLLQTMAGILALSLKSHPSIIGLRVGGSQSLSNIEALTYLHLARGVQRPVAEIWERIITLHLRLSGITSTVQVQFDPINLRPETELETHKLTRQTRLLGLLSLGIIDDDEFFTRMRLEKPKGYENLSGTNFLGVAGDVDATGGISNEQDGAAEQTLKPSGKRNDAKS